MPYADPERAREYSAGYKRVWRAEHLESERERSRLAQQKRRIRALQALGGSCVCCGESDEAFLCIDHADGGGAAHRRRVGGKGVVGLVLRGEHEGGEYQVLCANCNMAKERVGGCPHAAAE